MKVDDNVVWGVGRGVGDKSVIDICGDLYSDIGNEVGEVFLVKCGVKLCWKRRQILCLCEDWWSCIFKYN